MTAQTFDVSKVGEEVDRQLSVMLSEMKSHKELDPKRVDNVMTGIEEMRLILNTLLSDVEEIKSNYKKSALAKRAIF